MKHLSYIEDARCLKVNQLHQFSLCIIYISYPYHPFYLSKIIKTQKVYFLNKWGSIPAKSYEELFSSQTQPESFTLLNLLLDGYQCQRSFPWQTLWQALSSISCLQSRGTNNIYGLCIIVKCLNTCNTKKLISIKEKDAMLGYKC